MSHSAQYTNTLESRGGHRNDGGRADREILRWYNDQISWFRDDDGNRYQVRRHEGHSYRWEGRRGLLWTTGDTGFRDVRKHRNEGFAHHG
ncbi:hypothetical protein ACQPXS_44700 [Streptomyces sp. CA-142005]|uniref:hypothetical protein n=1 Tax=Streptomyces sp. CA-142005 TaxID=3240052 RepID=UPI003D8B4A76